MSKSFQAFSNLSALRRANAKKLVGFAFRLSLLLLLFSATATRAQSGPESGGHELQIWTGGGHGTNGSQSGDGVFNIGARFGWILLDPHGPGFLKGRFEYAIDVVPVFVVTQAGGAAYGAGVNPFALKWNFSGHETVVPYIDIGGGTLFTNIKTPPDTSHVNFTTSGAIGAHFLRSKYNLSAELRFMHISNAGLHRPNPGINTIQVRLGFGRFTQPND
jgi:Lipid A 3-O-deacylase (PagL)